MRRFIPWLGALFQIEVITAAILGGTTALIITDSILPLLTLLLLPLAAYVAWTIGRPARCILVFRLFARPESNELLHAFALRALSTVGTVVALQDGMLRRDQFWGASALAVIGLSIATPDWLLSIAGAESAGYLLGGIPVLLVGIAVLAWWVLYRKALTPESVDRLMAWQRKLLQHKWLGFATRQIQVFAIGDDVWKRAVTQFMALSALNVFVIETPSIDTPDECGEGFRWEMDAAVSHPNCPVLVLVADRTGLDAEFVRNAIAPLLRSPSCQVVEIPVLQWRHRIRSAGVFDSRWWRVSLAANKQINHSESP